MSRFGLKKFLNLTLNFRIIFHTLREKLYKDVGFSNTFANYLNFS